MTRWMAILLVGIGMGLGACSDDDADDGGDGGGGSGGSGSGTVKLYCELDDDTGQVTGCNEHTIPEMAIEESREACTAEGGTVVDACPTEGFVGKCSYGMGAIVMHFYEPDDPAEGEELCMGLGGTWTPG